MSIATNIRKIERSLPSGTRLIAVSKTRTPAEILEAYSTGLRRFGENKVQELVAKQPVLPSDIEWHFIGHLQRNKVKLIVPFISLIHSVDSQKLLATIDHEAQKINRVIPCLLQIFIADEETKFGLTEEEACTLLSSEEYSNMLNIRIAGVMGMATFTMDEDKVGMEFRKLKDFFNYLKNRFFQEQETFGEISMGMSSDYPLAVEEGSTLVRIGSSIFGERES